MSPIKRALISVSDKTGIVEFAQGLAALGIETLSTGGTARTLREAGVGVTDVSEVTGFPEMMDGRVKTLHPKIHGALLALRDNAEHVAALQQHGIAPIDLVVVNLYPFQQTVAKPNVAEEEAMENVDIGGPSMIRSAAKNFRSVAVVVDPNDYDGTLRELRESSGGHGGAAPTLSDTTRRRLAVKAFAHTSAYDAAICNYLQGRDGDSALPQSLRIIGEKIQDSRYGENPHQKAAFYREPNAAGAVMANAKQLHGKELSFNNILDCHAALELVKEFREPAACIIKHTNPCGCAIGANVIEAYVRAWEADPISRFGGIVALNRAVDETTANEIVRQGNFYECVIAPSFSDTALDIIRNRKGWGVNVRLLQVNGSMSQWVNDAIRNTQYAIRNLDVKRVGGGYLVQEFDQHELKREDLKVVTKRTPTDEEIAQLLFAFKVVKHVKSNAIVLVRDCALVGVGAGQPNRVTSVELAIKQAGEKAKGSVCASDALFPFPDGPEAALKAGATAIIQPGGSTKDADVIAKADEYGAAMVFTGIRRFRH
jgi:phosphoribosylaminoimidazolecarboxamide formyltransferase/IMP cyclohydrolase